MPLIKPRTRGKHITRHIARLRPEIGRGMVRHFRHQTRGGVVLNHNGDLFRLAERKGIRQGAPYRVARPTRQQGEVARRNGHEPDVIDHRDKADNRRRNGECDQPGADCNGPDEARLRREAT